MKMIGVVAMVAAAMAQSPKITSMGSNMVINALGGDVQFNTMGLGGTPASLTNMMSTLNAIPSMQQNAIATAVGSAATAATSQTTAAITPISNTISNMAAVIGVQSSQIAALTSTLAWMSPALSTLQATALQYVGSRPCNASIAGRVMMVNGIMSFCTGTVWKATFHEPLGTTRASAADSCMQVAAAGDAPGVGVFTIWIVTRDGSATNQDSYAAKCQFSTNNVSGAMMGISLGGDGSSLAEAGLSCSTINSASVWNRPAGVYWVTVDQSIEATDDTEIVEVRCLNGMQTTGSGADYRALAMSCTSLVTDFEENLYDNNTMLPRRFWQPIDPSINIANTPNPLGPAIATSSSARNQQNSLPINVINGLPNPTDPGYFRSVAQGEPWPFVSLQLAGMADISLVRVFLARDTCAIVNFNGVPCSSNFVPTPFTANNTGFKIRVANSECLGDRECPGTLCGWVKQMSTLPFYEISCPNGTIGNFVHFQLPGQQRTAAVGEIQVFARSAQMPCNTSTAFGSGASATSPGLTCRTIQLSSRTALPSGAYWVQPRSDLPPFQVWCDMVTMGGGWTIAEQFTSPWNNGMSYPLNAVNYADILTSGYNHNAFNGINRPQSRSLGKINYNALWAVFSAHTIIRWDYSQTNLQSVCAAGLYQRMSVGGDWDAFHAMRDTKIWDNDQDAVAGSHWATQFDTNRTSGNTYQNFQYYQEFRAGNRNNICRMDGTTGSQYDGTRNILMSNSGQNNMRFHQWEDIEIPENSYGTVGVSRHGAPGDPMEGCQWAFKFNNARSETWCNQDVSNFFMLK